MLEPVSTGQTLVNTPREKKNQLIQQTSQPLAFYTAPSCQYITMKYVAMCLFDLLETEALSAYMYMAGSLKPTQLFVSPQHKHKVN